MAGEIPDLHAEVRTGTGKGAARQVRRENYVPGIVYGGDQPPLPIKLPYNALLKKLMANAPTPSEGSPEALREWHANTVQMLDDGTRPTSVGLSLM